MVSGTSATWFAYLCEPEYVRVGRGGQQLGGGRESLRQQRRRQRHQALHVECREGEHGMRQRTLKPQRGRLSPLLLHICAQDVYS